MIYELEITDEKAKSVIAFLKQLDFVKIKLSTDHTKKDAVKMANKSQTTSLPYFNSCPAWDAEPSTLRHSGSNKRVKGW